MDQDAVTRYQNRAIARIEGLLAQGLDATLNAPVGTGKTNITLSVAATVNAAATENAEGGRVAVIQHTESICSQNAERAKAYGLDVSLAQDGKIDASGKTVYGLIQTVATNPAGLGSISLLIIDEAHHASSREASLYARFIKDMEHLNPGMRLLSSSATLFPERSLHPRITAAPQVEVTWNEAIAAGMVLPVNTIQSRRLLADGSSLQDRARDFIDPRQPARSAIGLNAFFKARKLDNDIDLVAADFLRRRSAGKTLFFTDRIEDAARFAACLNTSGFPTAAIHSGMPDVAPQIEAYKSGKLKGLVAVDMIGEGFDAKDTETVVSAKITTSAIEYIQMLGRTTRANDGKSAAAFIDYGASAMIHGRLDVFASVQTYLAPAELRAEAPKGWKWTPWTRIAPNLYGIDLGEKTLIAARANDSHIAIEIAPDKNGSKTKLTKLGAMSQRALSELVRAELRAHRQNVVSLLSDIDSNGTTLMARRLESTRLKYASSLSLLVSPSRTPQRSSRSLNQGMTL